MVDHYRTRIRKTEHLKQRELQRFRGFVAKPFAAVDDANTHSFEVRKVAQSVEDGVCITARPRGGAHTVEDQPKLLGSVGREIEVMLSGVQPNIRHAATIHFCKHRLEPPRVLVIDANRPFAVSQIPFRPGRTVPCAVSRYYLTISRLERVGCSRQRIVSQRRVEASRLVFRSHATFAKLHLCRVPLSVSSPPTSRVGFTTAP